ncbi:MAG TPA: stage II sporulation protein M [Bacteroidetes bacterium]|nr:stage II sporulation protein M [Bacteroidota bacterium]
MIFSNLDWNLIGLAAILFIIGTLLSSYVLEKNIHFLIAFPLWFYNKIKKLFTKGLPIWVQFLIIIVWNSSVLFWGYLSGFTVFLPYIFAIWTGLNVGILVQNEMGEERNLWIIFINPVSLFELPAIWISYSLAIKMSMFYFKSHDFAQLVTIFRENLPLFGWVVLPLLTIAALIESVIISYVNRKMQNH